MKEPITPIMGRMTGKGSLGEGLKLTCRTGVSCTMVWILPSS